MTHPVLRPGAVAVVTGAASGIGYAAAARFAEFGLAVALIDRDAAGLARAEAALAAGGARVLPIPADVSDATALAAAARIVEASLGTPLVLMNNAGIGPATAVLGPREAWERTLGVNLWGVINGVQAFLPAMLAGGGPGLVINTGSKQGITTPPGNPAYNVSKAGVKVFTEALAHELRNIGAGLVSAHLLIPGFVFTGLTRGDREEKPAGAWTPAETIAFMLARLEAGDFYILCPDNEVARPLDERRIAWAAGDIIENRPPLSRWHADYAEAFAAFLKQD